jgi:hypothetical protein
MDGIYVNITSFEFVLHFPFFETDLFLNLIKI